MVPLVVVTGVKLGEKTRRGGREGILAALEPREISADAEADGVADSEEVVLQRGTRFER